ncbi:MAG: NfeD family protein, partial [Gaiellaceae bacterium]
MTAPRGVLVGAAAAAAAAMVVGGTALGADAGGGPRVLVAEFENDVNPVTQEFLLDAIERGEDDGYSAVVIEMDTPGGLSSSMRAIVKGVLAAEVPVVVYVAPSGGSADSAGAVIGMAADVLAMAP